MSEPYLTLIFAGDVALVACTEHGSCYDKDGLDRHLTSIHKIRRKDRAGILAGFPALLAPTEAAISYPANNSARITALPVHPGYQCSHPGCPYLSTSEPKTQEHCRDSHAWTSGARGRGGGKDDPSASAPPYRAALLQTLWTEKKQVRYFTVRPEEDTGQGAADTDGHLSGDVARRYREAQEAAAATPVTIQPPAQPSERTPWLAGTAFADHLRGVDTAAIAPSYQLVDKADEPELALICQSAARLLRQSMRALDDDQGREVRRLGRVDAQLLNTFRRAETSQDPIRALQNPGSRTRYIQTWQKLIVYFCRGQSQPQLLRDGRPLFTPTDSQLSCLGEAYERVAEVAAAEAAAVEAIAAAEATPAGAGAAEAAAAEALGDVIQRLDYAVLALCLSFIQQPVDRRSFDCVLVSFAAVTAWDSKRSTWLEPNRHGSILAQITYDCQLLVLRYCLVLVDIGRVPRVRGPLVEMRDAWMLNDTPGPVAVLLGFRLLAARLGQDTVRPAQIRWHADGQTLVYQHFRLSLDQLPRLVDAELKAAGAVFARELCFGLDDIPVYALDALVDDWGDVTPGRSFLTDPRNDAALGEGRAWVFRRLQARPDILGAIGRPDAGGIWRLRADAVARYEDAVQRFLRPMIVLLHVASGQPARRTELLSLRWQNAQTDARKLYLHDGHLLFMLDYHKSINKTHSSRFPVRFVLPRVATLLVRFLVLVQPFRQWLSRETGRPASVSPYLWHDGAEVWKDDQVTDVLRSRTAEAIGVPLTIQAWRQLAIGIAIKKLSLRRTQLDLDNDGEEGDADEGAVGLPAAVHWQGSHQPRTGNAVYGGTVDYRGGLTDAGLQEYLHVSRLWHALCEGPRGGAGDTPPVKHGRPASREGPGAPLAKRLAAPQSAPSCRRVWTPEEALATFSQMYGAEAKYRGFQAEAIRAIIDDRPEVVAVLATGAGKSLLYQLPARLPGAGTTLLIVPLIALKQDTVRRCGQLGIAAAVWRPDAPPAPGSALVIASIDQAVLPAFLAYAYALEAQGRLARIVVDECHLVHTAADYRKAMDQVRQLRALGCPILCLTATLPPPLQPALEAALLLQRPLYIRSPTTRVDLAYGVVRLPASRAPPLLVEEAAGYIRRTLASNRYATSDPAARVLVFAASRRDADLLAERLGCPRYYSTSGTEGEKAAVLSGWIAGAPPLLVATNALAGVDYPSVRLVFHVDVPVGGAIEFAQGTGRANRDGGGGASIVLLPAGWRTPYRGPSAPPLPEEVAAMYRVLAQPPCRIAPLSFYLDGRGRRCPGPVAYCDRCIEAGVAPREARPPDADVGRLGDDSAEAGLFPTDDPSDEPRASTPARARLPSPSPPIPAALADAPLIGPAPLGRLPTPSVPRAAAPAPAAIPDAVPAAAPPPYPAQAVLRQDIQDATRELRQFVEGLDALRGSCVFCRFLEPAPEPGWAHTFDECRSAYKFEYLDARKEALRAGNQRRRGWLAKYCACFRCYNAQFVCRQQGRAGCRYGDLTLPLVWAATRRSDWRAAAEARPEAGVPRSEDEGRWMLWLGEAATVFGRQATNIMVVAVRLLHLLREAPGG